MMSRPSPDGMDQYGMPQSFGSSRDSRGGGSSRSQHSQYQQSGQQQVMNQQGLGGYGSASALDQVEFRRGFGGGGGSGMHGHGGGGGSHGHQSQSRGGGGGHHGMDPNSMHMQQQMMHQMQMEQMGAGGGPHPGHGGMGMMGGPGGAGMGYGKYGGHEHMGPGGRAMSPTMGMGQYGAMNMGMDMPGISPNMAAQRMQMSGAGGSAAAGMYGQAPASPAAYADPAMQGMPGSGPSSRHTPMGSVGGMGSASGASAGAGGAPVTQADREEELLLNLLIARRQRGRVSDPKGSGRNPSLAEELMRMRQQQRMGGEAGPGGGVAVGPGGAAAAGGRSGAGVPQLPGMPPLFEGVSTNRSNASGFTGTAPTTATAASSMNHHTLHNPAGGSVASRVGGGFGGSGMYDYVSATATAADHPFNTRLSAHHHLQDERIDRSPTRLVDARSQDMLEGFSGRGIKRPHQHYPHHPAMAANPFEMTLKFQHAMGGMGVDADMPLVKKKRKHKKKPADMPRRPLSAYNLFFSEERERILKEIDGGGKDDDDEGKDEEDNKTEDQNDAEASGDQSPSKPKALMRPLIPSQKKRRPHRKTHGKISFQELARMVGERWKNLPEDRRQYYQDLAKEDMKRQKAAMEEYYAKQNELKDGGKGASMDRMDIKGDDMKMMHHAQQSA